MQPLTISTFCEGPEPLFAKGVLTTIGNDHLSFRLVAVSDYEQKYCITYPAQLPDVDCRTRDARNPEEYLGSDIVCIIAPFAANANDTITLNTEIGKAVQAASKMEGSPKYLLFGGRYQDNNNNPSYGTLETYGEEYKFKIMATFKPRFKAGIGRMELAPGYTHYFTATGAKKDENLLYKDKESAFMFLTLLDLRTPIHPNEPSGLRPFEAQEQANPLGACLRDILQHENELAKAKAPPQPSAPAAAVDSNKSNDDAKADSDSEIAKKATKSESESDSSSSSSSASIGAGAQQQQDVDTEDPAAASPVAASSSAVASEQISKSQK